LQTIITQTFRDVFIQRLKETELKSWVV